MRENKTLSDCLERNGNNLDLARIIAALAVIYGHSYALAPTATGSDFIFILTGFHAGDLAVKTFFFMSGLLVTNSLLKNNSIATYAIHRLFRIMPGLLFVLVFTTFILGPIFTTLPVGEYFASDKVYSYVENMALMKSWGTQSLGYYYLPGLFKNNPAGEYVNAPIWTLSVEVFSYFFILATFLAGLMNKRIAMLFFFLILFDSLIPQPILFFWLPINSSDFSLIPYCFAIGGVMAVYKNEIKIGFSTPLSIFILFILFKGSKFDYHLFYAFFFTLVLYLSTLPIIIKIKIRNDLSYGVYLWGWPIQQLIANQLPTLSLLSNQLLSLGIALFFGYISWKTVEKPAIGYGKMLSHFFAQKFDKTAQQASTILPVEKNVSKKIT